MKFNNLFFKPYKDMFNLYNKIQKINSGFRLYVNVKNHKFAIVNIYKNFEICKEFNNIFENIEQDLRFSKIENYNKIINFVEHENKKLMDLQEEKSKSTINNLTHEILAISSRSNNILQSDINKIIGATKC